MGSWNPLMDHPKYQINSKGNIVKMDENLLTHIVPFRKKNNIFVTIDGEDILYSKLLLQNIYGYSTFSIHYKNGDSKDVDLTNIEYAIYSIRKGNECIYINDEEFKKVPDHDNVYISNMGLTYSLSKKRFCRNHRVYDYPLIRIPCENEEFAHRLVYSAWIAKLNNNELIHHKDNVKHHPFVWNLEKSTSFDNTRKAILDGLKPTYFNISQIEDIAKRYSEGEIPREIAKRMGYQNELINTITKKIRSVIYQMKLGISYKDIADKYGIYNMKIPSKNTLNEIDVINICNLINSGKSLNSIAKEYGVSQMTITKIRDRKTWKNISKDYLE